MSLEMAPMSAKTLKYRCQLGEVVGKVETPAFATEVDPQIGQIGYFASLFDGDYMGLIPPIKATRHCSITGQST